MDGLLRLPSVTVRISGWRRPKQGSWCFEALNYKSTSYPNRKAFCSLHMLFRSLRLFILVDCAHHTVHMVPFTIPYVNWLFILRQWDLIKGEDFVAKYQQGYEIHLQQHLSRLRFAVFIYIPFFFFLKESTTFSSTNTPQSKDKEVGTFLTLKGLKGFHFDEIVLLVTWNFGVGRMKAPTDDCAI